MPDIEDGQILVKTLCISVDPYMVRQKNSFLGSYKKDKFLCCFLFLLEGRMNLCNSDVMCVCLCVCLTVRLGPNQWICRSSEGKIIDFSRMHKKQ